MGVRHPAVLTMLGECCTDDFNSAEAEKAYLAALDAAPAFGPAHQGLAVLYNRAGLHEKAMPHMRVAVGDPPTQPSILSVHAYYLNFSSLLTPGQIFAEHTRIADLLRGDYKPSEYGRVILPFTVLRRLDCVLAPTKAQVLAKKAECEAQGLNPEPFLARITGVPFANIASLDLARLMGDQDHIGPNLTAYIQGFSAPVRDIFERFRFAEQTDRLQKAGLLYQVTERFAGFDLNPAAVSNHDMGLAFEELIRKFAEISNETPASTSRHATSSS